MVGVTKKEVSQMTKYYLKMDNIMKNMFVVALNDELQAQSEQDECLEETKALLKKVSEYDLAQKRLQITAGEQRLYGDVQPPPTEQSPVPESQGPAVTNAVLAGGLGLHPKGPVPYQPGKH